MKGYTKKNTNEKTIAALKSIAEKHDGLLAAYDVVKAAKSPRSQLHGYFNWDDSSAAQAYRLEQARHLIRATIQYIDVAGGIKEVSVFCSLSSDHEEGGYRQTIDVLANKEYRDTLLADAMAEMKAFVEKYENLKALAVVIKQMKKALAA